MGILRKILTKIIFKMLHHNDPIGTAIQEYQKTKKPSDIIVHSDLCEDDIIPVEVLFRSFKEMPEIEKKALSLCKGSILDVGAGTGIHALELLKKGFEVQCLEISPGAYEYLKSQDLSVEKVSFELFKSKHKFDTILLLMNGIGIAKTLENLPAFLEHAKTLLHPKGQLIFDSSDVLFLYENEDGSIDLDLNASYYGDFKFQMAYKKQKSDWFEWLYVDYDNLHEIARKSGFQAQRIMESDHHYLAQLTRI